MLTDAPGLSDDGAADDNGYVGTVTAGAPRKLAAAAGNIAVARGCCQRCCCRLCKTAAGDGLISVVLAVSRDGKGTGADTLGST
jgi:hypothetical protein